MAAPENKEIAELKLQVAHRDRWLQRARNDYAELKAAFDSLQEEHDRLKKERDELLGDNTKLKAQVDEYASALEVARCSERAGINPTGIIIRP